MMQPTELRRDLMNTLAEQAAESAVDMAGGNPDLLPTATAALDFITYFRYENETDADLIVLTPAEITNFRHVYCRHLRNLGIATDIAVARSLK